MATSISGSTGIELPTPLKLIYGGTEETASNIIVQMVRTDDGAVATGTTAIPNDDTIPQITEGDEYISQAITPKGATNKLIVDAQLMLTTTINGYVTVALFRDSTTSSVAAVVHYYATANVPVQHNISYEVVASSVSTTAFKVRAGGSAANTTTLNDTVGSRRLGGVVNSYIKVTEVTP